MDTLQSQLPQSGRGLQIRARQRDARRLNGGAHPLQVGRDLGPLRGDGAQSAFHLEHVRSMLPSLTSRADSASLEITKHPDRDELCVEFTDAGGDVRALRRKPSLEARYIP